jgi:RHS repeat-associated protein
MAYGYDAASRLLTVTGGTGAATYSYLANSRLVGQIAFANHGQTVMTTAKHYDFLNRLTSIQSSAGSASVSSFNYLYNSANQRTEVTNVDNSSWVYQYDHLGQVVSGKKYWANGTPVAGQQFTYNFDDIGNRQAAASGGDASGNNLRSANYAANNLNQYTSRDVPGYATVLGSANANATVTVNLQRAVRQGSYFWDELAANNSSASLYLSLTNLAVLNNGTNADIVATNIGNAFLPQTPETFGYDADGNMTNSGRWTITWDAENRAISFASLASAPLASQKKVDCTYDFQGRRIQKIVSTNNGSAWIPVSTNRFVYDGWNLIAVLKGQSLGAPQQGGGGCVVQSYTWGNDLSGSPQGAGGVGGLVGVNYQGNATTNCVPAFDGNGNLTALVNVANGAILASYEYGPFGEVIRVTGPMAKANPMRYSTKYDDDETGLNYYGYRYYDPGTGRWPSRDPMGEEVFLRKMSKGKARNVQQYLRKQANLPAYLFVKNDGLGKIDALGDTAADVLTKYRGGQIPKAVGINGSGMLASKIPGLSGWLGGYGFVGMFFPDSCEVAAYQVTAWSGWLGNRKKWNGGVMASVGVSGELACYTSDPTPRHADAASYAGPFYTGQISTPAIGVGAFFSLAQDNKYGGIWSGIDVGVGFGGGAAINEWDYTLMKPPLKVPKCLCYAEILAMP